MNKIILYIVIILFSFITKAMAQETRKDQTEKNKKTLTFEKQVENISIHIDFVKFRIKDQLKDSLKVIENKFEKGILTKKEYEDSKKMKAEEFALIMDKELNKSFDDLNTLMQKKVEGEFGSLNIKKDSADIKGKNFITYYAVTDSSQVLDKIIRTLKSKNIERRTTSQFVFAMGINNVITEGENLDKSDFRVLGSHFYEWGMTMNSRILKNNNLLHAKYGLSLQYNNLRPTDNRYFETNGNQTDLVVATNHLNDSRFRNVYLTAPVHLEFDFTPKKIAKDGTTYFRTHETFRLGVGGYAGVRLKSKQIIKYEIDDLKIKDKQKGDFNVSDFNYGLSAYLGYGTTSVYVKYDLNSMFKNNNIEQNNVSLGIRFDFN